MTKKRVSRKKKSNSNSMVTVLIIVVILAIISVAVSYFMLDDKDKIGSELFNTETKTEAVETEEKAEPKTEETTVTKSVLEGTWVSNYDGAMLSITGNTYAMELPSVDANSKVKGKVYFENTIVSFIAETGIKSCIGVEGHYNYSFIDDELKLNLIKDKCDTRIDRMSETWFKL